MREALGDYVEHDRCMTILSQTLFLLHPPGPPPYQPVLVIPGISVFPVPGSNAYDTQNREPSRPRAVIAKDTHRSGATECVAVDSEPLEEPWEFEAERYDCGVAIANIGGPGPSVGSLTCESRCQVIKGSDF